MFLPQQFEHNYEYSFKKNREQNSSLPLFHSVRPSVEISLKYSINGPPHCFPTRM